MNGINIYSKILHIDMMHESCSMTNGLLQDYLYLQSNYSFMNTYTYKYLESRYNYHERYISPTFKYVIFFLIL